MLIFSTFQMNLQLRFSKEISQLLEHLIDRNLMYQMNFSCKCLICQMREKKVFIQVIYKMDYYGQKIMKETFSVCKLMEK